MWRQCTECGRYLALWQFNKIKTGTFGLKGHCKKCQKDYNKYWRDNNKDYIKSYRQENKDYSKEYRKRWREENREHIREVDRRWCKENRDQLNATAARRRAKKRNQTPENYDKKMTEKLYKLSHILSKDFQPYEVDHIKPLSKGGPHDAPNLQVVTQKHNRCKGDNDDSTLKGITADDLKNHPEIFNTILKGEPAV